jgi:2'-5' RNA ligase
MNPTPASPSADLFGPPPGPAQIHRLFFALMPDEPTRTRLAQAAAALKATQASLRARWTEPARYHATMHFLGDHPLLREDIVQAAKAAADTVRAEPFVWELDLAASFRGREPPCVLRGSEVPAAMLQLWEALRTALIKAGQGGHLERRFTPHVTVAYSRGGMLADTPVEPPVRWRIERLALVHNVVGKGDYRILGDWHLTG